MAKTPVVHGTAGTETRIKNHSHGQDTLSAEVQYLARDPKHQTEKPYYLYYTYDHHLPRTNTENDNMKVSMRNARSIRGQPRDLLFEYGFVKLDVTSSMLPDDYFDSIRVAEAWYPQCKEIVKALFPDATSIEVLEHATRTRHPKYPSPGRERHEYAKNQPSDYVHIDYTSSSAEKSASKKFGIEVGAYRRFVALNIWKPIRGPIYDWPLCLCDRRTVDYKNAAMPMDIVTENFINENTRICYEPAHEWYYWNGMTADEVVVFIQADSDAEDRAGVPHTAFEWPHSDKDIQPRQSVEVRIFALFD